MLKESDFIIPSWPAPANVQSLQTTRHGGVSHGPYASLNLASHVQDNALHVAHNRQLLNQYVPTEPVWLNQVHGIDVVDAADTNCVPEADASFTARHNVVCVTMTADCLPILLCDVSGTVVASIHAGWRSLCNGVIEVTVAKMLTATNIEAGQLMAWLGPAIGPETFEIGGEVRAEFIAKNTQAESAFRPSDCDKPCSDKWLANIYQLATQRLNSLGINQIFGGEQEQFCTVTDSKRFFSFRRDNMTGRMATMIWLTAPKSTP